ALPALLRRRWPGLARNAALAAWAAAGQALALELIAAFRDTAPAAGSLSQELWPVALHLGVLVQTRIAHEAFRQAAEAWLLAAGQVVTRTAVRLPEGVPAAEVLGVRGAALLAQMAEKSAHAALHRAHARLFATLGLEPLPAGSDSTSAARLEPLLRATLADWEAALQAGHGEAMSRFLPGDRPRPAAVAPVQAGYALQFGAFREQDKALKEQERLWQAGLRSRLLVRDGDTPSALWLVRTGLFHSRAAAMAERRRIGSLGLGTPFLVRESGGAKPAGEGRIGNFAPGE
ncbi:MAG: SPOR domain-containing protein, partial [Magnetococcales bacterium]|nr:SPOR domain-containing protein [Magnetococcales bacterium]